MRLLTVNDECAAYAQEVAAQMRKSGVRVEVAGQASIPKLIRNAQVRLRSGGAVVGLGCRARE